MKISRSKDHCSKTEMKYTQTLQLLKNHGLHIHQYWWNNINHQPNSYQIYTARWPRNYNAFDTSASHAISINHKQLRSHHVQQYQTDLSSWTDRSASSFQTKSSVEEIQSPSMDFNVVLKHLKLLEETGFKHLMQKLFTGLSYSCQNVRNPCNRFQLLKSRQWRQYFRPSGSPLRFQE